MSWVRLDHSKLRNIGKGQPQEPEYLENTLAIRVYGWEGRKWPRLVLEVSRGSIEYKDEFGLTRAFWLGCNLRKGAGYRYWWQSTSLPVELTSDMAELLSEAGERLKVMVDSVSLMSVCNPEQE